VSVTYGAGGSTRDKTLEIVQRIKEEFDLEAMAHFTCVDQTVEEIQATLARMREAGIDNVLALRGDPPQGRRVGRRPRAASSTRASSSSLIRADYPFAVGAACFPETHIHATSPEDDLRYLKEKVDAGATFLITQMFFDNALYFDFVERARAIGIDVPIIPGICRSRTSPRSRRSPNVRGDDPGAAARRAGCPPRRAGGRAGLRRRLRDAAVRRAAAPRRARHPLLHAEPLARDARDPRRAEASAALAALEDLDLERLRHARRAVGRS
jgi:hypothetical protein